MVINYNHIVITTVNYDCKTFTGQATGQKFKNKHRRERISDGLVERAPSQSAEIHSAQTALSRMILERITLSRMTFCRMTLSRMTFSIIKFISIAFA
jgi:hypothetical protein